MDLNGGFTASKTSTTAGAITFNFQAQNSQGTLSASIPVTVNYPAGSGLSVTVLDGNDKTTQVSDYKWIIEEDRTFYVDPKCTTNTTTPPAGCPSQAATAGQVPILGVNFHTDYMPFVAQGCTGPKSCEGGQKMVTATGTHVNAVCDVGNGACRTDSTGNGFTAVLPSSVHLDPSKRYYISILPGDAGDPFSGASIGHGMGGSSIAAACGGSTGVTCSATTPFAPVTVLAQPSPYPPGKYSVMVFEDDFPLNGEMDTGGGTGTVNSNNEQGLGGFQIHLWDSMAKFGDFTGQMTYDMFNQPLTNSLAGTKDPITGNDACPVSINPLNDGNGNTDPTATGKTGMIVTCPTFESDGKTPSPLAGQAVVDNLMPGQWAAIATPGADRIARGEEWLQTNTLDGQKGHDVFTRIGEPVFFQEYGPAGYHNSIGFANPAIINARKAVVCGGQDPNLPGLGNCTNTVTGKVTGERLSRPPDERLYSSGSRDTFYWTQCYVSFGDPDGEDFAFTKCNADGTFTLTGLPAGNWRITTFDQWNDQLVDGLSTPVNLGTATNGTCPGPKSSSSTCDVGDIATVQWQINLYTRTFIDDNKDGISQSTEAGIPFANVAVRLRDGQLYNLLVTDFNGTANFNETFPLFNWYTVETDVTRYKNTGTHVVYDVGGPADGSASCGVTGYPPCGNSVIGKYLANTAEVVSLPTNLRVPGAVYCASADCTGKTVQAPASDPPSSCTTSTTGVTTCSTTLSSGRIDPPWVGVEGWQGFSGQNNFLEFGKEPYATGENGGIKGHVVYASTRPFDDPQLLVQTQWEPLVPNVTINLYQEGFAADGVTPTLNLVDTTKTSSWDDWAQGFHAGPGGAQIPNMSCPGQSATNGPSPDLFFYSLFDQPNYIDFYNSMHGGAAITPLPANSQFKCYDGMHNWNQIEPAPYDGMYQFPSVTSTDATTGKPLTTNCTICSANHAVPTSDLYYGLPMLPTGKYVVEVVLPPGFELVKEEDKNILIGDNFIAPVTQEFGGLGNIFIIPDQAQVGTAYNSNNAQNPTQSLGTAPSNNIVPGFVPEPTWPCVGEARIVPDYISLFPQSHEVAPFAGATRNLCDRKEVTLSDQAGAIAKFFIYTSTHTAAKFTGVITDDFTSEFDPFSPTFGEKFSPPDMPVSFKDWKGNEISRVYSDHWGVYNGMTYSSWEVNPPNPTGYSPTVMVVCMNDPGPIPGPNGTMITDPLFNPEYSQFCYELPFMPGTTAYEDTPVVPTAAFVGAGYNNPDCAYPDLTPAIKEVDSQDGIGPWVANSGNTITITSLGVVSVPNYAYSGPSATAAPYNQKTITRNYGFGASGTVTIGGVNATVNSWSDTTIVAVVPDTVPPCPVQQQNQYGGPLPGGGSFTHCGQLVITRGDNGKQSIDTVTITVGGNSPTHVAASDSIQDAIDAAAPGDLIIIDPTCATSATSPAVPCTATTSLHTQGAHNEMLIMWKPVRLQGVGAATSIINANTQPAGKLSVWRQKVDCLFGMGLNGAPIINTASPGTPANPFDPTGVAQCGSTNGVPWGAFNQYPGSGIYQFNPQIDRLPLEATVGWIADLNGNLAELLQEPSLMGALEGAAVTVLGKGVNFSANPYDVTLLAGFPVGTPLLANTTSSTTGCGPNTANAVNPFPSNFWCNPSSIDGLGITDSSQGGGGIFVHGWAHMLQIANNRIYSNAGTLSGGINIGQGEYPPSTIKGGALNAAPYDTAGGYSSLDFCANQGTLHARTTVATGGVEPYCFDVLINIHNNDISLNMSTGDELFSSTPAGNGGTSICTGADYYKFNYNWLCGNMSSGDGGGFGHIGSSFNGDIEHNSILFNQSLNPTIPTNGGGIVAMGAPDADPICSTINPNLDLDCVPNPANSVGPSDGVGPNLVINANLIMGNAAEAGSGGGIAFQNVNGSDVVAFPTTPSLWNTVTVSNNIIADNVAGWDGAGISLMDALNTNIVNNTIVSNSSTATSGVLFATIGAPLASSPGSNCVTTSTSSCPQPGGIVALQHSAVLSANLPATITCPPNHYSGTSANNGSCRQISYPQLSNDIIWQNSSYSVGVGALNPAFQQNVVTLYNSFTSTPASNQTITGQCVAGSYWDIGVRGDTGPTNHSSGFTLAPTYSILTPGSTGYSASGSNNLTSNPNVVSQYCDGSRTPPESGASGWSVPPGISDAIVPNPIFSVTPVATVDEGNNWINLRWGPLSLVNPVTNTVLGNYSLAAGSPAIDYIPTTSPTFSVTPRTDFFGNPRPETGSDTHFDVGAVEFVAAATPAALAVSPTSLAFGNQAVGSTSTARTLTLSNTGGAGATGITVAVTAPFSRPTGAAGGTCTATLAAATSCTINVVFSPTAAVTSNGTATITANVTVTGSPVTLTGTGVATPAALAVTPTSLAFGNQGVGSTSAARSLTLSNTGGTGATGITVVVTAPFSRPTGAAGGTCTTTLAAATSCTINVVFSPTAAVTSNGTATITANVTVTGSPVTLTGTGVTGAAVLAVTPTSLAFGNQTVGTTSAAQTLTLSNTGTAGATGIGLTFTGPYARAAAGGTCTTTLAAATSCTIRVTFHPTAVGSAPGTLAIAASVSVSGSPVTLTGNGTNGVLTGIATFTGPTPSLVTGSGTVHSGTVTVTNTATGATAGPLTMTGAPGINKNFGPGQFSITGGTCGPTTVLIPGASCTIIVQYDPGGDTTTASETVEIFVTGQANTNPNYTFSAN
jgi:hypothetical protein